MYYFKNLIFNVNIYRIIWFSFSRVTLGVTKSESNINSNITQVELFILLT